jgi:hypothetical protein
MMAGGNQPAQGAVIGKQGVAWPPDAVKKQGQDPQKQQQHQAELGPSSLVGSGGVHVVAPPQRDSSIKFPAIARETLNGGRRHLITAAISRGM